MYNKCIMIGNLARDPELKTVGSTQVCKFTIAMNHRSSKENQETCFIDVSAWGKQAEFVKQYFTKGKTILVEGRLRQDEWEKDGKMYSKHSIQADKVSFMGGSSGQAKDGGDAPMLSEAKRIFPSDVKERMAQQYAPRNGQKEIGGNNLDADELPF